MQLILETESFTLKEKMSELEAQEDIHNGNTDNLKRSDIEKQLPNDDFQIDLKKEGNEKFSENHNGNIDILSMSTNNALFETLDNSSNSNVQNCDDNPSNAMEDIIENEIQEDIIENEIQEDIIDDATMETIEETHVDNENNINAENEKAKESEANAQAGENISFLETVALRESNTDKLDSTLDKPEQILESQFLDDVDDSIDVIKEKSTNPLSQNQQELESFEEKCSNSKPLAISNEIKSDNKQLEDNNKKDKTMDTRAEITTCANMNEEEIRESRLTNDSDSQFAKEPMRLEENINNLPCLEEKADLMFSDQDIIKVINDDKILEEDQNNIEEMDTAENSKAAGIKSLKNNNGIADCNTNLCAKDDNDKHIAKSIDCTDITDQNSSVEMSEVQCDKNDSSHELINNGKFDDANSTEVDESQRNNKNDDCITLDTKETNTEISDSSNNTKTDQQSKEVLLENNENLSENCESVSASELVQSMYFQDGKTDTIKKTKPFNGIPLDIISDDEEEMDNKSATTTTSTILSNKDNVSISQDKCINIEDDDDVMLIDDADTTASTKKENQVDEVENKIMEINPSQEMPKEEEGKPNIEDCTKPADESLINKSATNDTIAESLDNKEEDTSDQLETKPIQTKPKPLVSEDFLKLFHKSVTKMTRSEIEDFCLLKIVEAVVDRNNLSEIKSNLKTMQQKVEEWRKKALALTKQNRDLQIVLKTVQEEQKKKGNAPITPLKITRSVGMQVFMSETAKSNKKKFPSAPKPAASRPQNTPSPKTNNAIPTPRLVPAVNSPSKPRQAGPPPPALVPVQVPVQNATVSSNTGKPANTPNKNATPARSEKRPFSSIQSQSSSQSVTVDLTDDEPPPKQTAVAKNVSQNPVRLVSPQHLLAPRTPQIQNTGPRKVYIPISQAQNIRPGQALMLRTVSPSLRVRSPSSVKMQVTPGIRLQRSPNQRHPAPLPDVPKQQQPPNWKALPPAPDLKISKVENGIVISWKIEGYLENSYEQIASYQLYAYQETLAPPSTLLWKKIGDVKALPLPMACTLTQFMAGYRYYFAVRAIDIRSRIGPFSLPGSILLLNK